MAGRGCLITATLHSHETPSKRAEQSKTEQAYWGHSRSKSQFRGGFFLSTQLLLPLLLPQPEAAHATGSTLRTGLLSSTYALHTAVSLSYN